MSNPFFHIQDHIGGFSCLEEPSERCMEPSSSNHPLAFIEPLDPILYDFQIPPPNSQPPTFQSRTVGPGPDASFNNSPLSQYLVYHDNAVFDVQSGLWHTLAHTILPSVEESPLTSLGDPLCGEFQYEHNPTPPALSINSQSSSPRNTSPPQLTPTNSQGSLSTEATPSFSSTPPTAKAHRCAVSGCYASFDTHSGLTSHRRADHKRFRCHVCSKPHADSRGLERHVKSKHGGPSTKEERKCRVCDRFGRADNMKRHERTRHGLE